MPTNRKLLLSLRDQFERLELFAQSRLKSLRERARMVIERVFGEDSSYYERLSNIPFHRRYGSVAIVSSSGGGDGETAAERQARERAWLSGQQQSIALINTMLEDLDLREREEVQDGKSQARRSNRVFVVHGHDEAMRESVARVLTKLGLEPVILHEQPNRGQAIIEKIERYSGVGFAVVLLSPDDTAYSNAAGPDRSRFVGELRSTFTQDEKTLTLSVF